MDCQVICEDPKKTYVVSSIVLTVYNIMILSVESVLDCINPTSSNDLSKKNNLPLQTRSVPRQVVALRAGNENIGDQRAGDERSFLRNY